MHPGACIRDRFRKRTDDARSFVERARGIEGVVAARRVLYASQNLTRIDSMNRRSDARNDLPRADHWIHVDEKSRPDVRLWWVDGRGEWHSRGLRGALRAPVGSRLRVARGLAASASRAYPSSMAATISATPEASAAVLRRLADRVERGELSAAMRAQVERLLDIAEMAESLDLDADDAELVHDEIAAARAARRPGST